MRKVFLQLIDNMKRLGCTIVFANFQKVEREIERDREREREREKKRNKDIK